MAQRDKEKHKSNGNNGDNKNGNNNEKKKEENFIRVPTTDMRVMAGAQVVVGGDKPANISCIHNLNIPVNRMVEIDLVEIVIPDGPYKGAVVYHPYPKGADIRLFKTPDMVKALRKAERRERISSWINSAISTVTFGVF